MKPCAFGDGDLVTLAFIGLKDPVINVIEGMLTVDCTPSHLCSNFGVTSKHYMDESFGAFFNVSVMPVGRARTLKHFLK